MDIKVDDEVVDNMGEDVIVWLKEQLSGVFTLAKQIDMFMFCDEENELVPSYIVGAAIHANYSTSEFHALRNKVTDRMIEKNYIDVYNNISIFQKRLKSN